MTSKPGASSFDDKSCEIVKSPVVLAHALKQDGHVPNNPKLPFCGSGSLPGGTAMGHVLRHGGRDRAIGPKYCQSAIAGS